MTKKELITSLNDYNDDDEVYIGEYQQCGCDFTYYTYGTEMKCIDMMRGVNQNYVPVIVMGAQCGVMMDRPDEEEE